MPLLLAPVALSALIAVFFVVVLHRVLPGGGKAAPARPAPPGTSSARLYALLAPYGRKPLLPEEDRAPRGLTRLVPVGKALDAYIDRGVNELSFYLAQHSRRGGDAA